jgi:hypothetical protein
MIKEPQAFCRKAKTRTPRKRKKAAMSIPVTIVRGL